MRRIILSATIWLLLLGNLAYFVWAQGALAPLGFGKSDQSEPQRLSRQISPERIVLPPLVGAKGPSSTATSATRTNVELAETLAATHPPTAAAITELHQSPAPTPVVVSSVPASASLVTAVVSGQTSAPAQCLQSQSIDGKLLMEVRRTLETQWPAGSWKISSVAKPGRWLVYMGKYPNNAAYEKKQSELTHMKIPFRPVKSPDLIPGLSLGEYDSQAKANQALQEMGKLGVRTAKVISESGGGGHVAVINSFTPKLQPLLDTLQSRLGLAMQACDKSITR